MSSPILGTDVVLQFFKDDAYRTFVCATECSIAIDTDTKDVRGPNSGIWKKKRGQSLSYRVSLNGLIELEGGDPNTFWLVGNQIQMLLLPWKMIFTQPSTGLIKIASGTAIVKASELTSSSTSFANSSFEFEGDGELVLADSATSCNATIGEISVGSDPDIPGSAIVNYTGVTNAARLEYSVDGAPREVIFDPGANGFFYLFGLSDGPHTLTVWAVCESGVDGENNDLAFEISGGEVGPSCAVPGIPELSDITATSVHLAWTASPSTPLDGYKYQWGLVSTGEIIGQNVVEDLFGDITGLTAGVEYFVELRALCLNFVNMSSWQRVEFTTIGACNVPGSPVMSDITNTTATATWTAPGPAPADGYSWQVLDGVTVIDSGTTPFLSVDLTDLPPGTSLTFRVKALCDAGVNESGYNSTPFETTGDSQIFWNFNEDLGNGSLVIRKNGIIVVNAAAADAGMFTATEDNVIQITLTATTGNITVTDDTASIEILNENGSGSFNESFTVVDGHNYTINATVTS